MEHSEILSYALFAQGGFHRKQYDSEGIKNNNETCPGQSLDRQKYGEKGILRILELPFLTKKVH